VEALLFASALIRYVDRQAIPVVAPVLSRELRMKQVR
jgi:hypothetical protein